MAFTLMRTLPTGVEKSQGPFRRKRDAATAAVNVLSDNLGTPKGEAQQVATVLDTVDIGETIRHEPSGYQFRITREAQR